MATRLPTREWSTTVEGITDGTLANTTRAFAIIDDVLWYGGTQNATAGFDSLIGISVGDGSVVREIELRTLLGISSGNGAFSNGDKAVDHNRYLWLGTQANGLIASRANYIVVDTVNGLVVTSIGTSAASTYNGAIIAPDIRNKLMWVLKNSTTLDAISTETYAVVRSLTVTNATTAAWVVEEDRDELWYYDDVTNVMTVYRSSTGAALGTITGAVTTGAAAKFVAVPEKGVMLLAKDTQTQIFSMVVYNLVGTLTHTNSQIIGYSPNTNEFYGYDLTAAVSRVAFWDADSYTLTHRETLTGTSLGYASATGTDGSIYYGAIVTGTNNDIVHKLTFSVMDNTALVGDSGLYTGQPDMFNRELILDLDLQAFYVNDFGHAGSPAIVDYVALPGFTLTAGTSAVYVGNDPVIITSGDDVVVSAGGNVVADRNSDPRGERFKYLTLSGTSFTLSDYKDYNFVDWATSDGVGKDFSSYLISGYDISTDMMRNKRSIYLLAYNERTETVYTLDEGGNTVLTRLSSCLIQPQWGWNTSKAQGKWGQQFQAYRLLRRLPTAPTSGMEFDYGERVIVTKNKLRGFGKALSILFQSESRKDMKLLGWAMDVTKQDFI